MKFSTRGMTDWERKVAVAIRRAIRENPDAYRLSGTYNSPYEGCCYAACEAFLELAENPKQYRTRSITFMNPPHWFVALRVGRRKIDLTCDQYDEPPFYNCAWNMALMPKRSKRGKLLAETAMKYL